MTTASMFKEKIASSSRVLLGALALAVSGVLFVLYPLLRPFSNEASLQGAAAFASRAWILAHLFAVIAFILLTLGLLGLYIALQHTATRHLAFVAFVMNWIGVGLILPYYGAEMFGLRALGQEALRQHSTALLALVDAVRLGPGAIVFVAGLLLLAVGAILVAIVIWQSGTLSRWSGIPFALGLALYLPQFFGSQPLRVAHGLLVALGCIWIAFSMLQDQYRRSQLLHHQTARSGKPMTDKHTSQASI